MDNAVQRLTSEIIERCLALKSVELLGPLGSEVFDGDRWSEIQAFKDRVTSSEKLQAGFFRVITALFDEACSTDESAGVHDVKALLESGKLTFRQMQILEDACRQFFFLGWHSRGAVEQDGSQASRIVRGYHLSERARLRNLSTDISRLCKELSKRTETIGSKIRVAQMSTSANRSNRPR